MVDTMSSYFGEDPYDRTSAKQRIKQAKRENQAENQAENQSSSKNTSGLDSGTIASLQRNWNELWGANSKEAARLKKSDNGHGGILELTNKVCELAKLGLYSMHDYAASPIPLNQPE